jgi:Nucleotidyl transferase AbiEii toxin, Type IV TA system
MTEISAEQAYRALQRRAREEQRGTEELLIFYAHEGFLRRLSMSPHREKLVLKGGMLLAVLDARRPTRDADLSVHGLPNDEASIRQTVSDIARITAADGLKFDTAELSTTPMREDAEYHGIRVTILSTPTGCAQPSSAPPTIATTRSPRWATRWTTTRRRGRQHGRRYGSVRDWRPSLLISAR